VVVGLGEWLLARRPLDYQLQGCAQIKSSADCRTGAGVVSFSDGSRIALQAQTAMHITPLAFARGAELSLDDGQAELAVVHRPRARWAVAAGPFRVEVTGTRFSVAWSKTQQALDVGVREGEVHVSGGALTQTVVLRAGQTLQATARPSDAVEAPPRPPERPNSRPSLSAGADAGLAQAAIASTEVPAGRAPTTSRPRGAVAARRRAQTSQPEPSAPAAHVAAAPAIGSSLGFERPSPSPSAEAPTGDDIAAPQPLATAVGFASDGQLTGAMTGFAWLSRGSGTTLSSTAAAPQEDLIRLQPDGNGLCARGTVAGLRCVNENTPQARCNWDRNWGVAIGFKVNAQDAAWGDAAAKALALEFHGRSAAYRLNAHRKSDSNKKNYCIENYRSGQRVTPAMFKTRCWDHDGDTLPDFNDVDWFNLQFSSGMQYVAFRYCVSGIHVER
jgi:hypothetical protein